MFSAVPTKARTGRRIAGSEPLVILLYFSPDSCPNAPGTGAFKNPKRG
jgi:hypothetical protein